jgi:cytochrome P450
MASARPNTSCSPGVPPKGAVIPSYVRERRSNTPAPSLPLPGVVQTFILWREPLRFLDFCHVRYGNRFVVRPVGTPPFVFFSDPVDIKSIIAAPADVLHPGSGADVLAPLIGEDSFMLLEGSQHMDIRKAILPAFHHDAVNAYADCVKDIADREIARWPLDTPFPLHPHLCALTLKVILTTLFGEWDDALGALYERLFAMQRATPTLALQEPGLRRFPGWRSTWKNFVKLRAEARRLLYAAVEKGSNSGNHSTDPLTLILTAGNPDGSPRSSKQVCDNIMTTIISGHETTASELAWAFQLLAHYPNVRRELTDEIDRAPGDYLAATVYEVLRHRPVFPFAIPRAVQQPIEIGNRTYRPPAHLLACIYLAHHDRSSYPDPHEFRPGRFLARAPQPHLWLPWGGGRKRCPGRHLAILEMQTVLSATLSKLDILPANSKIERAQWRSVIVTPHAGSRVILRKRAVTGRK